MIRLLKNMKLISFLVAVIGGMSSCESADQFYEFQKGKPEVQDLSTYSYTVGDTITFVGRLNPEQLKITIGGIEAKIAKVEIQRSGALTGNRPLDRVKTLITDEMGRGPGISISLLAMGQKVDLKPIEILPDQNMGLIKHKLKLTERPRRSSPLTLIQCLSGTGTIFYWDNQQKALFKMLKDDTEIKILDESAFVDEFGAFSIDGFIEGAGIDLKEKYLYFSANTKDKTVDPKMLADIIRIVRCDLTSGKCVVLNRTVFPRLTEFRTLETVMPFEGKMKDVKIVSTFNKVIAMFDGSVYFLNPSFITRMEPNGDYRYLYKFNAFNLWDPKANKMLYAYQVLEMLPGTYFSVYDFITIGIAPDEHVIYLNRNRSIVLTDVNNKYDFQDFKAPYDRWKKPITNASFESYYEVDFHSFFGPFSLRVPLPGRRLLGIFYLNKDGKDFEDFQVFGIFNFKTKRIDRYSPGKIDLGELTLWNNDLILNYDQEGMFYTSANENKKFAKTEIVKNETTN